MLVSGKLPWQMWPFLSSASVFKKRRGGRVLFAGGGVVQVEGDYKGFVSTGVVQVEGDYKGCVSTGVVQVEGDYKGCVSTVLCYSLT